VTPVALVLVPRRIGGRHGGGLVDRCGGLDVGDPALARGVDDPPHGGLPGHGRGTMSYTSGTTGRPRASSRPVPTPSRQAPPNPYAAFWGLLPGDGST